jgi:hypothetical protein
LFPIYEYRQIDVEHSQRGKLYLETVINFIITATTLKNGYHSFEFYDSTAAVE